MSVDPERDRALKALRGLASRVAGCGLSRGDARGVMFLYGLSERVGGSAEVLGATEVALDFLSRVPDPSDPCEVASCDGFHYAVDLCTLLVRSASGYGQYMAANPGWGERAALEVDLELDAGGDA